MSKGPSRLASMLFLLTPPPYALCPLCRWDVTLGALVTVGASGARYTGLTYNPHRALLSGRLAASMEMFTAYGSAQS